MRGENMLRKGWPNSIRYYYIVFEGDFNIISDRLTHIIHSYNELFPVGYKVAHVGSHYALGDETSEWDITTSNVNEGIIKFKDNDIWGKGSNNSVFVRSSDLNRKANKELKKFISIDRQPPQTKPKDGAKIVFM